MAIFSDWALPKHSRYLNHRPRNWKIHTQDMMAPACWDTVQALELARHFCCDEAGASISPAIAASRIGTLLLGRCPSIRADPPYLLQ